MSERRNRHIKSESKNSENSAIESMLSASYRVIINTGKMLPSTASAVHIGQGKFVTSDHIFSGLNTSSNINMALSSLKDNTMVPVTGSRRFDAGVDLALLTTTPQSIPYSEISSTDPKDDEKVYSVWKEKSGRIIILAGTMIKMSTDMFLAGKEYNSELMKNNTFLFIPSNPKYSPKPGASGSGIFNKKGQLAGIVFGSGRAFEQQEESMNESKQTFVVSSQLLKSLQ